MVLLRIGAYSIVGRSYTFAPFWGEWLYHFGNDFLTYAMFLAGLPAIHAYGLWLDAKLHRNDGVVPRAAPLEKSALVDRLVVRKRNREFILAATEIDRIESAGNYIVVHAALESYRLRDSLDGVLRRLGGEHFVRVHRAHVVNIARIREIQPWDHGDYRIVMKDGSFVNFSRRYRSRLPHLFR
jgi:DNA-binding LytR/AlgR family response regulator